MSHTAIRVIYSVIKRCNTRLDLNHHAHGDKLVTVAFSWFVVCWFSILVTVSTSKCQEIYFQAGISLNCLYIR